MLNRPATFVLAVLGMLALTMTIMPASASATVESAGKLHDLAIAAVSTDSAKARAAQQRLRSHGAVGLDALLDVHTEILAWQSDGSSVEPNLRARVRAAVDNVAGQRDAHVSRLYWYTDLDTALAAAEAVGKPVLSLYMLGRLDEEYSCANSRFFRTALYANQAIGDELREHYILHWHSVRPVPRITIDMGDGRRIERTITGNSIHYVLTSDGRVIDAFPGLYGPQAFLRQLQQARQWQHWLSTSRTSELALRLTPHASALSMLDKTLAQQMRMMGIAELARRDEPQEKIAAEAMQLARSKMMVEWPMLSAMDHKELEVMRPDDAFWEQLAEQYYCSQSKLDDASLALIREKLARIPHASPVSDTTWHGLGKQVDFDTMIERFEQSIAIDTARNEHQLRRTILTWLHDEPSMNLTTLNDRVYADLFRMPTDDAWLGLVPEHTYSALDSEGLLQRDEAR